MTSSPCVIERKAVDVSGRLGSLYDASTDNLINRHSVQASETKSSQESSICRIFSVAVVQSKDVIDYLKCMDFNNALQQSILFGMVKTSGVSSLINYNQPVKENIRFLYYSYRSKEELISGPKKDDGICSVSTTATHMITKILWGFEILCVITIPDHQSSDIVDSVLRSISIQLKNTDKDIVLTDNEKRHITQLMNVTVYGSETCIDSPDMPLLTVLTKIRHWQKHENFHHPLKYTMQSLRWFYNNKQFPELSDLPQEINIDIEQMKPRITFLNGLEKHFKQSFQILPQNFSSPTLDKILKDIQQYLHTWMITYQNFRKNLRKIIADVRRRRCESIVIQNLISNERYLPLTRTEIEAFNKKMNQLLKKVTLIKRLNEDNIEYIHVSDLRYHEKIPVKDKHIEKALRRTFSKEDSCVFILYSNDQLKDEDPDAWNQVYAQLISERQQAPQRTAIVYVDFTECQQYDLKFLATLRLPMHPSPQTPLNNPTGMKSKPPVSSPYSPPLQRPPKRPSSSSSLPATEINVLLLGETGVGKSTFVNAFVNYLMFDTLQQAEQSEPIVLIPVAFVITEGDQFDEFIVKFGNVDANENHEHQGQSVTQQCKSYVFNLNDRIRLRLIDTPGMGDTRGIDQDDKNIDHVLTYVNNLSHLNAICLLLKPNTSRLNVFFRSCINQLLTYLTPIGYNNIVFCFTNARSTFFAPGNTGPLLRKMLKQEHHEDISFQKENTFCFDSESFRYLAARKCGVNFDEFQIQECIKSWSASVIESIRLLDFIQTREAYFLYEWQSPKKCALEISMLARPLMETLRLILYNWKLRETGINTNRLILKSNSITVEICTNCAQSSTVQVGSFLLVVYGSHKNEANKQCACPLNERHFVIEYIAEYEWVALPMDMSSDNFMAFFDSFLYKCDRLSYFLRQKGLSDRGDPFTPILERFLDEERQLYEAASLKSNLNRGVKEVLRSISRTRQQNSMKLTKSNEKLSLNQIDQIISELKSIPDVNKQLECIKKSRQLKMQADEYRVKIPSIKNKTFAKLTNSLH